MFRYLRILKLIILLSVSYNALCSDSTSSKIVRMSIEGRYVFLRLENDANLKLKIDNVGNKTLQGGILTIKLDRGDKVASKKLSLKPIQPGKSSILKIPIETKLAPGSYKLQVNGIWQYGSQNKNSALVKTIFIVEKNEDQMPVIMWGTGNIRKIKNIGFTHELVSLSARSSKEIRPRTINRNRKMLDMLLKYRIGAINRSYIGDLTAKYPRINRKGKPYARKNLDAANPKAVSVLCERAETASKIYGKHPAFDAVMVHTEVRDKTNPSFSGYEQAAYKKFSGKNIPESVNSRWSLGYQSIPGFPVLRVVPDNYPLLVYYKWFWKHGDGWNNLNGKVSNSYHKYISKARKFWSFNDPAVRVPPVWGAGGHVDCISHWTYTYPEPLKIGQVTDELIAMSAGKPGQKIMKMTQAIWYRSQVAPGEDIANKPEWLKAQPKARFISIAPDNLRESFWLKISRRLDGIMYHGYQSLVEPGKHRAYRFTNDQSKKVLTELIKNVVVPLGPLLKNIPEKQPQMAILESFATSIFAPKQHSFGWGGSWSANFHLAMQWAHYQPAIFYEEHIQKGMLDKIKVLALIGCEVLPKSIFDAIIEFQRKGGIIIGDEYLTPGILPDILVKSFEYDKSRPEWSKKELQKLGQEIRGKLNPFYQSPAYASNQDIIVRMRKYKNVDYLFLVNDRRTFGSYVGQWKRIMEKGLPCSGKIYVNTIGKIAYDLVAHRQIKLDVRKQQVDFNVKLPAGDGMLIMFLESPISELVVTPPEVFKVGEKLSIELKVIATNGNPVKALLPVKLCLQDEYGKKILEDRYLVARDGVVRDFEYSIPVNLKSNSLTVTVTCLASGKTVKKVICKLPRQ